LERCWPPFWLILDGILMKCWWNLT
jgi:hypothetical protein